MAFKTKDSMQQKKERWDINEVSPVTAPVPRSSHVLGRETQPVPAELPGLRAQRDLEGQRLEIQRGES